MASERDGSRNGACGSRVLAGVAALLAAAFVVAPVELAGGGHLTSAVFAIVGICVLVLAAANVGSAVNPADALLLFYAE